MNNGNNENSPISKIRNIEGGGFFANSNTLLIVFSIFLPLLIIIVVFFAAFGANSDHNGTNSGSALVCVESGFTIDKTSLSKSEFVEKLTNYVNQSDMDPVFGENAGNIYDNSVNKNINPELVVVRAYAESQGYKQTGNFNYWGINCTNTGGGKDCESFDTFMDGVDRFIEIVSQYDSLNTMMATYSYIGDYWYNPGDAGVGGCYYKDLIYGDNIPARVQTACEKDCDVDNTTNCVKTTEQEQNDYRDWQVKTNMASIRKRIFGLEASEGVICSGNNGKLVELTDYVLDHEGLSPVTSPLSDSIINEINGYIRNSVNKSGYGTGAGVAAAGQALINGLRQKGYYLPYYWAGGHGDGAEIVGISSYFGSSGYSCSNTRCYHYHSFDCSGFVSWTIRNGCKSDYSTVDTSVYYHNSAYGNSISINEAKPGDIMVYRSADDTSGHIRVVIKNNGDGSIITAESAGGDTGVVFKKYSSLGIYKIRDMTQWYANNCDKSA